MPKIELELSHYRQLVHELETLVKVGTVLTVDELLEIPPATTLLKISNFVFEETKD